MMKIARKKINNLFLILGVFYSFSISLHAQSDEINLYVLNDNNKREKEYIRYKKIIKKNNKKVNQIIDFSQSYSQGVLNQKYFDKSIYDLFLGISGIEYSPKYYSKYLDYFLKDSTIFIGGQIESRNGLFFLILESLMKDNKEGVSTEGSLIIDDIHDIIYAYYKAHDTTNISYEENFVINYIKEDTILFTKLFNQQEIVRTMICNKELAFNRNEFTSYLFDRVPVDWVLLLENQKTLIVKELKKKYPNKDIILWESINKQFCGYKLRKSSI